MASRLVANGFTRLGFVLKNPPTDNRFVARRTDRLDRNTLSGWLAVRLAKRGERLSGGGPETINATLIRARVQRAVRDGQAVHAAGEGSLPNEFSRRGIERGQLVQPTGVERSARLDQAVRELTVDRPLGLFGGAAHRRQRGIGQHVGGVAVDHHRIAVLVRRVSAPVTLPAVGDPSGFVAGSVQDSRVRRQHHKTPAAALQSAQKFPARSPVNQRRHPPLRRNQMLVGSQQRTLETHAVDPLDKMLPAGRLARVGVHRAQVRFLPRQQARGKVGGAIPDKDAGSDRPKRNQPAIIQNQPFERLRPERPNQRPPIRIHTAHHPVVGAEVNAVVVKRRRNSHRPVGVMNPKRLAGERVEAAHRVVHRRAEEHAPRSRDDVKNRIVISHRPQAAQAGIRIPLRRAGPSRLRRLWRLPNPGRLEHLRPEIFRG